MTTEHELLRLDALHEYGVLDAPADDELEAVVRVAAYVAGKPFATLNLIDEKRQCQLTSTGFEGGISQRGERLTDLAGVILALFERRRQARLNAQLFTEAEAQHHATKQAHEDLAATNAEPQRSNTELEQFAGVVRHDQAVTDLRAAIDEEDAEVIVAAGLPLVHGDGTLIRQLLQNLIGNAVKYRHPDRRPYVEVNAVHGQDCWSVSVCDNGRGIPAEHRGRVFEMFTRVDRTPAGHGVGLSTCQRIAERHGGRIWAGGTPGGGGTMTFTLPDA